MYQPADTHTIEILVIIFFILLRTVTIAIKYAYIPIPTWYQLNNVVLSSERLAGWLILVAWKSVSSKTADKYADLSFVTVTGHINDGPCLKFLPQPKGLHDLLSSCHLQGKVTRDTVVRMLLGGSEHMKFKIPVGIDLTRELPSYHEGAGWSFMKA